MSMLSRGQKIKLVDLSPSLQLKAGIGATVPGLAFDISCFGVDGNAVLSDDRYFVFYNQPASPEGAVRIVAAQNGDAQTFDLDLAHLPASIQKLVFVFTLDGEGEMRALESGYFRLEAQGQELARFPFTGRDFSTEKAIMVAEIYQKDVWRVAAVGQGFVGGLPAVLKHFGGEESEEEAKLESPTVPTATKATFALVPESETANMEAAEPERPKVVSLTKAGSSVKINLSKAPGEILATAMWVDNGDRRSDNDDLDLRAGILFPDGSMSIVTCDRPGSFATKPFVFHTGDVTEASQQKPGEERMKVNAQIGEKYGGDIAIVFSIYSAISNGAVSIASLQPQMKLQYGEQIVECKLDFSQDPAAQESSVYTYVIGITIIRNGQVEISPGGQVSEPGSEETPWLRWDGRGGVQVTMDGPCVFKNDDESSEIWNEDNDKRYV